MKLLFYTNPQTNSNINDSSLLSDSNSSCADSQSKPNDQNDQQMDLDLSAHNELTNESDSKTRKSSSRTSQRLGPARKAKTNLKKTWIRKSTKTGLFDNFFLPFLDFNSFHVDDVI